MPDSQMEANSVSAWRNGWMDLRLGFKMSGNRTLADAMYAIGRFGDNFKKT